MMSYWNTLNQTVEATIRSGQIGTPVFVRCTVALAEKVETIRSDLAEVLTCVNNWLSASPSRIYALEPSDRKHVSVTLEYASGCAAVVCISVRNRRPLMDLIILGSKGACYHNESIPVVMDGPISSGVDTNQAIMNAINQSLSSGNPVDLNEGVAI